MAQADRKAAAEPASLAAYVLGRADLPASELTWLNERGKTRSLPRGAVFCDIGQAEHELGFVERGILQVYAVSSDGDNVVLDFQFPGSCALALDAAVKEQPSQVCVRAVTPCQLRVWPYDLRLEARERHRGWDRLAVRMTEDAFVRKHQRYVSLRTRTARERFDELDSEFPPGWRDIPQHLIASYLAITPQYLSTLRRGAADQVPR